MILFSWTWDRKNEYTDMTSLSISQLPVPKQLKFVKLKIGSINCFKGLLY